MTDHIFGYWYFALETNVVPVLACCRPQYQVNACLWHPIFCMRLKQTLYRLFLFFFFSLFCFIFFPESQKLSFVNPYNVTRGSFFLCPPVSCSLYIKGGRFFLFIVRFCWGLGHVLYCFLPLC